MLLSKIKHQSVLNLMDNKIKYNISPSNAYIADTCYLSDCYLIEHGFMGFPLHQSCLNHFTSYLCRVFCVKYTYDGTYLVSGSDDTNLRLWKSKASEQLGVVSF
jgi:WD40 repeat protein